MPQMWHYVFGPNGEWLLQWMYQKTILLPIVHDSHFTLVIGYVDDHIQKFYDNMGWGALGCRKHLRKLIFTYSICSKMSVLSIIFFLTFLMLPFRYFGSQINASTMDGLTPATGSGLMPCKSHGRKTRTTVGFTQLRMLTTEHSGSRLHSRSQILSIIDVKSW